MPSCPLNLRIEPELDRVLRAQAAESGKTLSELVRALLREAAGVCDPFTSGYREGYLRAYAEARQAHDDAHHGLGGGRKR